MVIADASDSIPPLDLACADGCRVLLLADGTPIAWLQLPPLGPDPDGAIGRAVLSPYVDAHRAQRRMRHPRSHSSRARPTCSVVVCTHRRPDVLRVLLDSARQLDPAPDELLVVDNDPGGDDCRDLAERAGARYIEEPRHGLDNARRA